MPTKTKKKKEQESKKAAQKKKEKIIEDKTFGLKNKNKSKKVQAHIQSVQKNVMNTDPKAKRAEEERKRQKAQAKARKKAMEDERNALFGEALLAVQKKSTQNKKAGQVEAKGRDHDDDNKKAGTSRAMKLMYQMDAKEMEDKLKEDPNYVPTLEDEIEAQRQLKVAELKKTGKGTPVTEKSFQEWQERKRKRKAQEAKKKVEIELKKKKGGKGLSVLTGRDLFDYKRDLFDDSQLDTETNGDNVETVAAQVQSDLFLQGDDDDLDDIEDD